MTVDTFVFKSTQGQLNKKEKRIAVLADILFLWMYLTGIFGWLFSAFQVSVLWSVVLLGFALAATGITVLFYTGKKVKKLVSLAWILIMLLIAVILNKELLSGINLVMNEAIDTIGKTYPYMWPTYGVTVAEDMSALTVSLTAVWVSGFWGFLGIYIIKSGNRFLLSLHFVMIFLLQIVVKAAPSLFWNIFVLMAVMAIWLRIHGEKLPAGRQRFASFGSLILLFMVALILLGFMRIAIPMEHYKKPEWIESWQKETVESIYDSRYQGSSQVLPDGDFEQLGSFSPTENTVLTVTMTEPESYYLRGFTGSVYKGDGWEETNDEIRWESHDLFYWLHDSGYYGQEALSQAAIALGDVKREELNIITIKNINGNSAYCYVPYELNSTFVQNSLPYESQKIGDENLMTEGIAGSRSYAYAALPDQVTGYASFAAKLLDAEDLSDTQREYQKLERYYNEFVYKTYLDIPGNVRVQLKKLAGEVSITEGEKHTDYAEAKQNILYILSSECVYQEALKEEWNGTDLVVDFLTRTKEGYSVHYASAAVLLFRYYGIPARYVEGYLVTPQDVEHMAAEEPYMIDETHAHAWVEYYQDGVGWLPFETTPSYLNVMPKADDYQDISGTSSGSGTNQKIEEEDLEDEAEEEKIFDWLLVLEIVLLIGIAVFVLLFLGLLIYVVVLRNKSKKTKKLFAGDDKKAAVRSIFSYTMNILAVAGLQIKNTSLYRYGTPIERMFDEDIRKMYEEVVGIRQEAVYSDHEITEEQREVLLNFKDIIWQRVYKGAGLVQKFQLKYIYFL